MHKLVDELRTIHRQRKNHRRETYRCLVERAKERVLLYAKGTQGGRRRVCCTYDVPLWLPNRPLYDAIRAAEYVVRKLRKEHLEVQRVDRRLYIMWSDTTPDAPSSSSLSSSRNHHSLSGRHLLLHQLAR